MFRSEIIGSFFASYNYSSLMIKDSISFEKPTPLTKQ